MDERTELLKRIAELEKELAALSTPKKPRTSKNPRSPLYAIREQRGNLLDVHLRHIGSFKLHLFHGIPLSEIYNYIDC